MNHLLHASYAAFTLLLPALPAAAQITVYPGMCDASAAVAVGPKMFVVANDEDNELRVYHSTTPGDPAPTLLLDSFLGVEEESKEADIEGATRVGDRVYWIASHGRNKEGKERPNRLRLFAIDATVVEGKVRLAPVEEAYKDLLTDLLNAPGLKDLNLKEASEKAPEDPGGLNIEGLTRTPEGALLIAFRSPIPDGAALLVPLENPQDVVDGKAKARLGTPIRLALDGKSGIRSIEYDETKKTYLIISGPPAKDGAFNLYRWSGRPSEEAKLVKKLDLQGMRPEAFILYPGEKTRIQVLSDDGDEKVDGKDCKKAKPEKRSFRSVWVDL